MLSMNSSLTYTAQEGDRNVLKTGIGNVIDLTETSHNVSHSETRVNYPTLGGKDKNEFIDQNITKNDVDRQQIRSKHFQTHSPVEAEEESRFKNPAQNFVGHSLQFHAPQMNTISHKKE